MPLHERCHGYTSKPIEAILAPDRRQRRPLLHHLLVCSPAGRLNDRELDSAADNDNSNANAIRTRGRPRRPDFGPGEWWAPQTRPDAYLSLNYN